MTETTQDLTKKIYRPHTRTEAYELVRSITKGKYSYGTNDGTFDKPFAVVEKRSCITIWNCKDNYLKDIRCQIFFTYNI